MFIYKLQHSNICNKELFNLEFFNRKEEIYIGETI